MPIDVGWVRDSREERRAAALIGRGHDFFPLADPVDVVGEQIGDVPQFALPTVDTGHAPDAPHAQGIERVRGDAVLPVLRPQQLDGPVEDRSPHHGARLMPVESRLIGVVGGFVGAYPQPL